MNKNYGLVFLLFVTIFKNNKLICCDRFFTPRPKTPAALLEDRYSYNPFLSPECLAYAAALADRLSNPAVAPRAIGRASEVISADKGTVCSLSPCSPAYSPKSNYDRSK